MELVEGAESRSGGSREGVGVWSALGARGSWGRDWRSRSCGGEGWKASSVRSMVFAESPERFSFQYYALYSVLRVQLQFT